MQLYLVIRYRYSLVGVLCIYYVDCFIDMYATIRINSDNQCVLLLSAPPMDLDENSDEPELLGLPGSSNSDLPRCEPCGWSSATFGATFAHVAHRFRKRKLVGCAHIPDAGYSCPPIALLFRIFSSLYPRLASSPSLTGHLKFTIPCSSLAEDPRRVVMN